MSREGSRTTSPITVEIVETVARREGVDPAELPPLSEAVDTDALDRLVHSASRNGAVSVNFEYCGHAIHVGADGQVTLE